MDVQDYRTAGYSLSSQLEQSVVTRAEKDVVAAYIVPLLGRTPSQDECQEEPLKTAIMALSFLLIQQRSIAATRAGAKNKLSEQSSTPTYDSILRENAPSRVRALAALGSEYEPYKVCSDVCKIFFRTNYFYS